MKKHIVIFVWVILAIVGTLIVFIATRPHAIPPIEDPEQSKWLLYKDMKYIPAAELLKIPIEKFRIVYRVPPPTKIKPRAVEDHVGDTVRPKKRPQIHVEPIDSTFSKPDSDLVVQLHFSEYPNSGLDKFIYKASISSLDELIRFCKTHHEYFSYYMNLWERNFPSSTPSEIIYSRIDWAKVKRAVIVGEVNGLTTYSLSFKSREVHFYFYRAVFFSNGMIFAFGSGGV